ncbi:T-box transcription factor TBX18-like [Sycon ciliatum]|uniref:T-box transcription factor TBX18-like n=1 Tax=Sycon ciliatum TaxID=27933 RepID=UPI0031F6FD1B
MDLAQQQRASAPAAVMPVACGGSYCAKPQDWIMADPNERDAPQVVLADNEGHWEKFSPETMEMVVTRDGRRLFPRCKFQIRGLNATDHYKFYISLVSADGNRYKYDFRSTWTTVGMADPPVRSSEQLYCHPDSPSTGDAWSRQSTICFDKLKITNREDDDKGHIFLHTMQKYRARVYVVRVKPNMEEVCWCFDFPKTTFIAVTTYNNDAIRRFKVKNNAFAKGHRQKGALGDGSDFAAQMTHAHAAVSPSPSQVVRTPPPGCPQAYYVHAAAASRAMQQQPPPQQQQSVSYTPARIHQQQCFVPICTPSSMSTTGATEFPFQPVKRPSSCSLYAEPPNKTARTDGGTSGLGSECTNTNLSSPCREFSIAHICRRGDRETPTSDEGVPPSCSASNHHHDDDGRSDHAVPISPTPKAATVAAAHTYIQQPLPYSAVSPLSSAGATSSPTMARPTAIPMLHPMQQPIHIPAAAHQAPTYFQLPGTQTLVPVNPNSNVGVQPYHHPIPTIMAPAGCSAPPAAQPHQPQQSFAYVPAAPHMQAMQMMPVKYVVLQQS